MHTALQNQVNLQCERATARHNIFLKKRSHGHMMQDARTVAWYILKRLDSGISVQEALDSGLRTAQLSNVDRALCTELVYGCLRMEIRIEVVLTKVLSQPKKLPRSCWLILEVAAYAMLFLQKIPHYAIVNWAVESVHTGWGQVLARVANGALRSLSLLSSEARTRTFYSVPVSTGGKKARARAARMELAQWYSMPQWIVDIWHSAYGENDACALLERSFQRPWSCVRLNMRHNDAHGVQQALTAWMYAHRQECALVGKVGWAFAAGHMPECVAGKTLAQWQEEGLVTWQAAGSQMVLTELGCDDWRVPVWDACCGQGGKSMFLLEQNVPVQLCSDMHMGRLGRVQGECQRLGLPIPQIMRADMRKPPLKYWDGNIILDVPCTGLGTLARRPDIRRHRSYNMLEEMQKIQQDILEAAWSVLAQGRELAYITCALDPQENEGQIKDFISRHADVELVREWQTPHTHMWLEGMYGACLRKRTV